MSGAGGEQSLGEFLRQERENRGLTLEQVASGTKIAVRVLSALEADQYCDLPAKPFVRGFVNSYARFLGLDSKEVLTAFGDYIERRTHERPKKEQGHSGYAFEKRETEQSRTILGFILGAFLLGGIVFLLLKPSLKQHKTSHLEKLKQIRAASAVETGVAASASPLPVAQAKPEQLILAIAAPLSPSPSPSPSPVPAAQPSQIPVAVTQAAGPATPPEGEEDPKKDPLNSGVSIPVDEVKHKAVFRALEDVWVRFQVDQRKPMRFVVRKDKVLVLRARETIRFQVSDPNLIRFNYNGRAAKLMTEEKSAVMRGADLTLIFPAQVSETIKEPFPGAPAIHGMEVPARPGSVPSPTPEQ